MSDAQPLKRTEKIQVMLDDEELRTIDDWRFGNRIPTRAAAIRELLRRGLSSPQEAAPSAARPTRTFRVTEPGRG